MYDVYTKYRVLKYHNQLYITCTMASDAPPLKMAKKPVERKLHNPEAHERINYLLHLATSTILTSFNNLKNIRKAKEIEAGTNGTGTEKEVKYFNPAVIKKELKEAIELAQVYIKTLREVAKKSVIRL